MIDHVERVIASNVRPLVFDDFEQAVSYDGIVRLEITRFAARMIPHVAATHVLVRSKLFAMTVAVANLALGHHLTVHDSRVVFEKALKRALGAARREAIDAGLG